MGKTRFFFKPPTLFDFTWTYLILFAPIILIRLILLFTDIVKVREVSTSLTLGFSLIGQCSQEQAILIKTIPSYLLPWAFGSSWRRFCTSLSWTFPQPFRDCSASRDRPLSQLFGTPPNNDQDLIFLKKE